MNKNSQNKGKKTKSKVNQKTKEIFFQHSFSIWENHYKKITLPKIISGNMGIC